MLVQRPASYIDDFALWTPYRIDQPVGETVVTNLKFVQRRPGDAFLLPNRQFVRSLLIPLHVVIAQNSAFRLFWLLFGRREAFCDLCHRQLLAECRCPVETTELFQLFDGFGVSALVVVSDKRQNIASDAGREVVKRICLLTNGERRCVLVLEWRQSPIFTVFLCELRVLRDIVQDINRLYQVRQLHTVSSFRMNYN